MSSNRNMLPIGSFYVTGGTLTVHDPCYADGGSTFPAHNGRWDVRIGLPERGGRVSWLEANAHAYDMGGLVEVCTEGVDSGQMGIYDGDQSVKTSEELYEQICEITLKEPYAGIVDGVGAVSSTAYGDGSYPVQVRRNQEGEVVAIRILFEEDPDYVEEEEDDTEGFTCSECGTEVGEFEAYCEDCQPEDDKP